MIKNYAAAVMYKRYLDDLYKLMDNTHETYAEFPFEIFGDEETIADIKDCLNRARASIRRADELMDERIKEYYKITSSYKESE